jgi:hypothetical protein
MIIFLASCGSEVYDSIGNTICKDKEDCGSSTPEVLGVPYNSEKFADILNNSRLHYPDSQTEVDYGEFDDYVKNYFYLDDSLLTFQLDKQDSGKYRSELRLGPKEWDVSEDEAHVLKGRIKCYGSKNLTKYTFVQIHGDKNFNLPLLRIVWERRHDGKTNHIWAIIMTSRSLQDKDYEWIDLGKRKSSFVELEVSVRSNNLHIIFDDKIVDRDVSYWYDVDNYYKVGLYLNDKNSKGVTKVQFDSLKYIIIP